MTKKFDIDGAGHVRGQVIAFPMAERRMKTEIFDMRAIKNIREVEQQTGKSLLPSILDGFTGQMQEKLQELAQNIRTGDAEQIIRTAHSIKSMSASIGAEKVRLISSNIEARSTGGELTNADESIASLSGAFDEFVAHFRMEFIDNRRDRT